MAIEALTSCVHIPTTKRFNKGLKRFKGDLVITDDSVGKYSYPFKVMQYNHFKLFNYLHKSSASKNYSLYKTDADIVYIIDSDCIIGKDFQKKHKEALARKGGLWDNPLEGTGFYPRGYPYSAREKKVVANVGLWTNVLDINGADRKSDEPTKPPKGNKISTSFIPFSGMNVAVLREALPALFFLPNIGAFRRHDDIFGGYIFQALVKRKGDCISYGEPFVYHETVVVPEEDARDEEEMNKHQDEFCDIVDSVVSTISVDSYLNMYKEFADKINFTGKFEGFNKPIKIWASLW